MIQAIVGAGGKTSLIKKYAEEYLAQGKKVFVTTSTHMFIEEDTLVTDHGDAIIEELERTGYVMAGNQAQRKEEAFQAEGEERPKIRALSEETYLKVCEKADAVLIEADGSKHLPIKFPSEKEPVIYQNVDEIIVVCGLHAIGHKAKEVSHRWELVKECLEISEETPVTAEHIQKLVRKGYLEPLKKAYPDKKIKIEPNHNDSLYQRAAAALMRADLDVSLLKEEWFQGQPTLIICGGGHVSSELVKMAAALDFYIKVLDDREEFACQERFPDAHEVICDTFYHLDQYLEPNAYYCVVTRGHKDDFVCVKTILQQEYQYLGMIGSSLKVQQTFEHLREEGIPEEKIQTVFAPIGLSIKAVTPAEIAVSILAQIIQEKNTRFVSSATRELLSVKERGTLCIIIEKTGSSPRGVGSMMFVGEKKVIGSIGGGAVELEVIKKARTYPSAMIKEYKLNREDGAKMGMICGGTNTILFIPV